MSNGKSRSLLALAGFGLATAGAAWYGSRYSRGGSRDSWYRHLDKPGFTPPDNAFPVVWTSLVRDDCMVGVAHLECCAVT